MEKLNEPLTREHIDFRVNQVLKVGPKVKATILAYKDARVDMQILDEAVGQMNWQVKYKRDTKGILQSGIGIKDPATGEWVWKWSNGTESNMESEKGEYSDAFKRAGFMWGIGRKLYDFPSIWIDLMDDEYEERDGKVRGTSKLRPNSWTWEISEDYQKVKAIQEKNGTPIIRFAKGFRAKKDEKKQDGRGVLNNKEYNRALELLKTENEIPVNEDFYSKDGFIKYLCETYRVTDYQLENLKAEAVLELNKTLK